MRNTKAYSLNFSSAYEPNSKNTMKRIISALLFIIIFSSAFTTNASDSIYNKLISIAENRDQYLAIKEDRISKLRNRLSENLSNEQLFMVNKQLFEEYKKYDLDSAIRYTQRNILLSKVEKNNDMLSESNLQLVLLYATSGMFLEAHEILESIDRPSLNPKLLAYYYEVCNQFYSHYQTSTGDNQYSNKVYLYLDSLVMVGAQNDIKYKTCFAEQMIAKKAYDTAEFHLLKLLEITDEMNVNYAMAAYLLGQIYESKNDIEKEKKYYAISAISDIKNSLRDNASMFNLALIYFEADELEKAYHLTELAINDAVSCKVMFRTGQMYEYFNIMNSSFLAQSQKQKKQLLHYLILISFLTVILIGGLYNAYRQMKKISRIREKLVELNNDFRNANEQLNESNIQLVESNQIKEAYIAHFFDLCSAYIAKFEDYRKLLNKRAVNNQFEELVKELKSTKIIDNELDELYSNFDHIFLKLYPTFVEEFNALLNPDERIVLKPGELLNKELRIFALIRLGITDSIRIASFLRYSLSTIYNYRSSIKNRVSVSRDDFEKMVMKIGVKKQ